MYFPEIDEEPLITVRYTVSITQSTRYMSEKPGGVHGRLRANWCSRALLLPTDFAEYYVGILCLSILGA